MQKVRKVSVPEFAPTDEMHKRGLKEYNKAYEDGCHSKEQLLKAYYAGCMIAVVPVLSDLEIVQKALSKSGAVLTMYLDGSGNVNSLIDEDENILSFSKAKELLTWAKQTLEQ